jgi:hypothetical protein
LYICPYLKRPGLRFVYSFYGLFIEVYDAYPCGISPSRFQFLIGQFGHGQVSLTGTPWTYIVKTMYIESVVRGDFCHGSQGLATTVSFKIVRFFGAVDRAILEHHSRPSGLPLILAALPEHHGLFRQVSQNPFLMNEGIEVHPDALAGDVLRERAWRVVEPKYLARLGALVEEFGKAKAKGLGSDELEPVAQAALAGRVATALIEAERHVPGRIDVASGQIEFGDLAHPEIDDLLDEIGEAILNKGGQIVIVPGERMPTRTGIAAIYRF